VWIGFTLGKVFLTEKLTVILYGINIYYYSNNIINIMFSKKLNQSAVISVVKWITLIIVLYLYSFKDHGEIQCVPF